MPVRSRSEHADRICGGSGALSLDPPYNLWL